MEWRNDTCAVVTFIADARGNLTELARDTTVLLQTEYLVIVGNCLGRHHSVRDFRRMKSKSRLVRLRRK